MPKLASTASLLSLAALVAAVGPAEAAGRGRAETSRLAYSVSLAGIPIVAADLVVADGAGRYALALDWRTTGLAEIFAGAHGAVTAAGRFAAAKPSPERYHLGGTTGRTHLDVSLAMSGGRIRSVVTEPKTRPSDDLIPLGPEHRAGVLDPLSAVLAPARDDGTGVCARNVPIFDGWSRYDVRLSLKATRTTAPAGFVGPVQVCSVRWVPIAGHRTRHNATRYMADNTDIEITFARLDGRDYWLPVDVSVRTMVGTAHASLETATVATAPTAQRRRSRLRS